MSKNGRWFRTKSLSQTSDLVVAPPLQAFHTIIRLHSPVNFYKEEKRKQKIRRSLAATPPYKHNINFIMFPNFSFRAPLCIFRVFIIFLKQSSVVLPFKLYSANNNSMVDQIFII